MSMSEWIGWVIAFGLVFVLGGVLVVFNIRGGNNEKNRDVAIAEGYSVYLDGVKVDIDRLDVDKYGFSIDYENNCVLLNSVK